MANKKIICPHCQRECEATIDPFNGEIRCLNCDAVVGRDANVGPSLKVGQLHMAAGGDLLVSQLSEQETQRIKRPPRELLDAPRPRVPTASEQGRPKAVVAKAPAGAAAKSASSPPPPSKLGAGALPKGRSPRQQVPPDHASPDVALEKVPTRPPKEQLHTAVQTPRRRPPQTSSLRRALSNTLLLLFLLAMAIVLTTEHWRIQELQRQIHQQDQQQQHRFKELATQLQKQLAQLKQQPNQSEYLRFQALKRVTPAVISILQICTRAGEHIRQYKVGSGVIFKQGGYAITNYHVAKGVQRHVICILYNGKRVKGHIIGEDPVSDLSLLKLPQEELQDIQPAQFGDSNKLQVGQTVIALGSPSNLQRTVSLGILSNTSRYLDALRQLHGGLNTGYFNLWLQTDAAINKGNSGGPLINLQGQVIGINTRKMAQAQNIGFAIPINYVKRIIQQLLLHKKVRRSYLGIIWAPYPDAPQGTPGARVRALISGSPADEALLQQGDVILKIGQQAIQARFNEDLPRLRVLESDIPVGQAVPLTVERQGQVLHLRVVPQLRQPYHNQLSYFGELGLYCISVTPQLRRDKGLRDQQGLWVAAVQRHSPADRLGILEGDVLLMVNGQRITQLRDFMMVYKDLLTRKITDPILIIRSGNQTRRVTFRFH